MRQNFSFLDKWDSDGATTHGNKEIREQKWFCLFLQEKFPIPICVLFQVFWFLVCEESVLSEPKNLLFQLSATSSVYFC